MNIIHIHDVLDMIYQTNKIYTIEELKKEVVENYGDDINLTSCSDHLFEIDDMINFMQERGKIRLEGEKIYPTAGQTCEH